MMKNTLLACLIVFVSTTSFAQKRDFGAGFIVGEPTGFSAKLNLSDMIAIDGGLAWSFSGKDSFHIHSDLLFHSNHIFEISEDNIQSNGFDLYYGFGVRMKFNDGDDQLGLRAPIGLEYLFHQNRLGAFVELAGVIDVAPDTDFTIHGGIGLRYYF